METMTARDDDRLARLEQLLTEANRRASIRYRWALLPSYALPIFVLAGFFAGQYPAGAKQPEHGSCNSLGHHPHS